MTTYAQAIKDSLSGYWVAGSLYSETAGEPLERIANRLAVDLDEAQGNGLVHPAAAFTVTAVGETVLETRITGLTRSLDPDRSATRVATKAAFELASHYNRVNLAFPARTRFIHQILAAYDNGALYGAFVGVMVGDGQPWPGPHPTPPQPTPESDRDASQVGKGQA